MSERLFTRLQQRRIVEHVRWMLAEGYGSERAAAWAIEELDAVDAAWRSYDFVLTDVDGFVELVGQYKTYGSGTYGSGTYGGTCCAEPGP